MSSKVCQVRISNFYFMIIPGKKSDTFTRYAAC